MNDKRETMREDEKNALIQRLNSSSQYLQSNDMKVVDIDRGFARVEMIIDEHILNIHGFVHGGALFSLADTVAGAASFATGRDSVTLTGSINYIKPGKGGKLIGVATEISAGRTTGVYEVFIYNDEQVLLCRATFTMFFLDGERYRAQNKNESGESI
ncbi:PaaI family thioesterase [uncultured Dubosiella sp.]|uniref:PaaI family thioesterase n=1 Tax=uncultured Dubosiella sp. TaxID=1937011 RepID=UPI002584C2DF|nr:PaaI family thioesterase [uncultured Dubosiella sp.]